ncbi:hypothetical protein Pdw03_0745 [Penicillium digitatum]|uniref:Uncharacterized protein n=3 Tax=Penicillium digitatum TaxID=36651 RepID=K9FPH1_PEND2|nr:hypothetical protein PDIP_34070 [Penicillium digitatum Pd1]EKV04638.1 hypothetical protein PDIG_88050 [Penicillium digitatum PHI26]EKV16819.1 hypothetical protein PDIP_34070 [Penicillium digitatum Pd1]KAG0160051.1 hypothetical protein PDIDSM_7578 [Penicillium digitatum]QQK45847.1 hypothetical protein Pdw03_0745 [Penicillium digitatum]
MLARRIDQSSNPHSQFFSASQNIQRGKHPQDSDSISPYKNPDSSESILSDERSIYNAIRVTTPNDSSPRFYASLLSDNPVHEQGLAVNMARFIPTDSQEDQTPTSVLVREERRQRMAGKLGNHTKLLSDQYWQTAHWSRPPLSTNHSNPSVLNSRRPSHRKAVSLGDGSVCRPKWPGNLGPAVITVQPRYPPPERTPTPPGLPSFGTSEAVSISARFMIPDNPARSHANLQGGGPAGDQRGSSCGDTLRRFFGLLPASHASGIYVNGIGRAEDGTLVQGRFPHRQSGHGMNIGRPLQDHPFHQRLPIARHEASDTSYDPYVEAAQTKSCLGRSPNRHVQPLARSPPGRHFPFPSDPVPAVINCPLRPRTTALLTLSRNLAGSDGPRNSVELSAQGTRTTRDHTPPNPSRLHSVLTMAGCGGGTDENPHSSMPVCPGVLAWLNVQRCLFCCCTGSHEESDDSLGATSSRETYVTAQSQVSPAGSQNESSAGNARLYGLQAWIVSLYGVMFPTLVNPATV